MSCTTSSISSGETSSTSHSQSTSSCRSEGDSDSGSSSRQIISLLDRLKSPTSADIARKRKTQANQPPTGKQRCKGPIASDPKKVTPNQRVREFSEEPFTVTNGHLFCKSCRENISLKRSIIAHHIQSTKHKQSKERLTKKEAREKHIADMLVQHNAQTHQRGETLPQEQQVYRVKVVTSFLKAGVPLNKIDSFRDILEENAYHLTDRRNE